MAAAPGRDTVGLFLIVHNVKQRDPTGPSSRARAAARRQRKSVGTRARCYAHARRQ